MTVAGMLSAGFAIAALLALLALLGLILLTASESVHIGRLTGAWTCWRVKRRAAKDRARARRLPVARLVSPTAGEVVSLRDVTVRRCK